MISLIRVVLLLVINIWKKKLENFRETKACALDLEKKKNSSATYFQPLNDKLCLEIKEKKKFLRIFFSSWK